MTGGATSHLAHAETAIMSYCILEIDNGLLVAERLDGTTAEDAALRYGAMLVDPGPYESYEEACEALEGLQQEMDDEGSASDIPMTRAIESRMEARE
jgi:hypothetical protein